MAILTRRNAVLGWVVWEGAKRTAKFKAKRAAGVVAIDAEATVETVADGMAPHPTLSEAIKEAGLVALGRAIHVPNRKRAKTPA